LKTKHISSDKNSKDSEIREMKEAISELYIWQTNLTLLSFLRSDVSSVSINMKMVAFRFKNEVIPERETSPGSCIERRIE